MSSIDLRTVSITPLRNTFTHLEERFGDKPASRYQEGSYRMQAETNFHYRPTWSPQYEIFDKSRTAIVMEDWYAFRDPRQFYYGTYTLARAKMQESTDASFTFVEERGLAASIDPIIAQRALDTIVPLRHVAWGANLNNAAVAAYGYGTTFTQPCLYASMDQLGIAQYLTRFGLVIGEQAALDAGKTAWLEDQAWQPLRNLVEDTWVIEDPFELFVAQNVAIDGLLFPLIYTHVDSALTAESGPTISMLLQFPAEWFAETRKWVDSVMATAVAESDANRELITKWVKHYVDRAADALAPIAALGLDDPDSAMTSVRAELSDRAAKWGIEV